MSAALPVKSRPQYQYPTDREITERAQAKLVAHQAYLDGLIPESLKAEDARQQIKHLEEDLWIISKRGDAG